MVASATPLPVIGVPVPLKLPRRHGLAAVDRADAGPGCRSRRCEWGARNAGLLAVRILGASDPALQQRMADYQAGLEQMVLEKDAARAPSCSAERLRNRALG